MDADPADSGIGILLIEQFATVALDLASHAYIMEGGQLWFSGPARQLRDKPELLRSAYPALSAHLLRTCTL